MIDSSARKEEKERKEFFLLVDRIFPFFLFFFPPPSLNDEPSSRPSTFDVHRRKRNETRRDETERGRCDYAPPRNEFFSRIHATPRNLGIKARPSFGCDAILIATPSSKRGRARVGRSIGRQLPLPRIENQIIRSKDRRRSLFRSISAGP